MKLFKGYFIIGFLLLVFMLAPLNHTQAVSSSEKIQRSEIGIELLKSNPEDKDDDEDKETIYTPDDPRPIRVLPDTGEIISSFLYMILGLSILLFLFGVLINR